MKHPKIHVGPIGLSMDYELYQKIKIMAYRATKKKFDNWLLIEGKEGYGKTTLAADVCYTYSNMTGRPYTVNNIFFDPEEAVEVAKSTEDNIIHFDEGALAALASEWNSKIQKKFIKLAMIARKKRHLCVICIPKIRKLNEYLIERAIGMARVYSPDGLRLGDFVYYREKALNSLWENYKRKRLMEYKKYYSFRGSFQDKFAEIVDAKAYDEKKDQAILNFDKEKPKENIKMLELQYNITEMLRILKEKYSITYKEAANMLKVHENTIANWQKIGVKYPEILGD